MRVYLSCYTAGNPIFFASPFLPAFSLASLPLSPTVISPPLAPFQSSPPDCFIKLVASLKKDEKKLGSNREAVFLSAAAREEGKSSSLDSSLEGMFVFLGDDRCDVLIFLHLILNLFGVFFMFTLFFLLSLFCVEY